MQYERSLTEEQRFTKAACEYRQAERIIQSIRQAHPAIKRRYPGHQDPQVLETYRRAMEKIRYVDNGMEIVHHSAITLGDETWYYMIREELIDHTKRRDLAEKYQRNRRTYERANRKVMKLSFIEFEDEDTAALMEEKILGTRRTKYLRS